MDRLTLPGFGQRCVLYVTWRQSVPARTIAFLVPADVGECSATIGWCSQVSQACEEAVKLLALVVVERRQESRLAEER
jgi:hypothetical protein